MALAAGYVRIYFVLLLGLGDITARYPHTEAIVVVFAPSLPVSFSDSWVIGYGLELIWNNPKRYTTVIP